MIDEALPIFLRGGEEDAFAAFRLSAEDTLGAVGGAVGSMASGHVGGGPGAFHSWMVYFIENPIKMNDDWGYPHFRKPPYLLIYMLIYVCFCLFGFLCLTF